MKKKISLIILVLSSFVNFGPFLAAPSESIPSILKLKRVGDSVEIEWSNSDGIPSGGFDIIIDGVDTGTTHRTKSLVQKIETKGKCFKVEARNIDKMLFPRSVEKCVFLNQNDTSRPEITQVVQFGNKVKLSWKCSDGIPDGGFDILIDGIDTGTQHRNKNLFTEIETKGKCFKIEARYIGEMRFPRSAEKCLATLAPQPSPGPSPGPSPSKQVATIDGSSSDQVEIYFPNGVQDARVQDFKALNSHVKIINTTISGKTLTLLLDDHVLPDDPLTVDYFMPSGTLKNSSGQMINSFQISVENRVKDYNGQKNLVKLSSGAKIAPHLKTNSLVALKRGHTFNDNLNVAQNNITVTAWGSGPRPILNGNGQTYAVQVYSNHFRISNLEVRSHGKSSIALRGAASFALINSNKIQGNNSANVKAIYLMNKTSAAKNKWGEGNWALNNVIRGHEDGIKSRLEPASWNSSSSDFISWEKRRLGGGQTPMLVELNDIKAVTLDGREGDAIGMSRGGYFGSKIRRNKISGWSDDGIDNFGARGVIVEYNFLENQNTKLNSKGSGNGIKMGGDLGGQGQDDRSGNNIYRYNIIKNTIASRDNPKLANAIGMTSNSSGSEVGPTYVYGNIVIDTAGHAFQLDKADGNDWKIYNNIFMKGGERGQSVSQYLSKSLNQLYFVNNIYKDSSGISIDSKSNLQVKDLKEVYSPSADLAALKTKSGSKVIDAGTELKVPADKKFNRSIYGAWVDSIDIGPLEN